MRRNMGELLYAQRDGIATITLNRPQRLNALGRTTTVDLCALCEQAIADPEVRVLVLTGAGEAFCAGGDYKDTFEPGFAQSAAQWRARVRRGPNRFVTLMQGCEKPVIAAVNGIAVGGGSTIAMACDLRIASERARFGMAFAKVGVTPEFGSTYLLPRLVGLGKAMELMLGGEIIDAREAERIGLVNRVVPHEQLHETVMALARALAARPAGSLGLMKSMLYRALSMDLPAVLEMEALALSAAVKTEEHQAIVRGFLAERAART